jgi:hypothetical protein
MIPMLTINLPRTRRRPGMRLGGGRHEAEVCLTTISSIAGPAAAPRVFRKSVGESRRARRAL